MSLTILSGWNEAVGKTVAMVSHDDHGVHSALTFTDGSAVIFDHGSIYTKVFPTRMWQLGLMSAEDHARHVAEEEAEAEKAHRKLYEELKKRFEGKP
jgi:hypothetical protein